MEAAKKLLGRRPKTAMGIDSSSQSFAYGCIADGKLVECGELFYHGKTVFHRILDARTKLEAFVKQFDKIEHVCTEQTIKVNSVKTQTILSYFEGIVIAEILAAFPDAQVTQLAPLKWQRTIGNPPLNAMEKTLIKKQNPGHTVAWYRTEFREYRKRRTADWVEKTFGLKCESNNVTDAISVAACAYLELNPGAKLG